MARMRARIPQTAEARRPLRDGVQEPRELAFVAANGPFAARGTLDVAEGGALDLAQRIDVAVHGLAEQRHLACPTHDQPLDVREDLVGGSITLRTACGRH